MRSSTVMVVFGTRPEAIKMAPVVQKLRDHPHLEPLVVVTGQHRQMLDQALAPFAIVPDEDLDLMLADQGLASLFSRILSGVSDSVRRRQPDLMLVHGDTSTTLAAALAAFYARVPIGHVEAGLRTQNMAAPWPEEMNRRLTAPLARIHFAPTASARTNLLAEGILPNWIEVTGNTAVDAILSVSRQIRESPPLAASLADRFSMLDASKRLVLVTGHRRENFGPALEQACSAILDIASREDIQVVYPVHLNPNVQGPVNRLLAGHPRIFLIEPQDYLPFVYLMSRADLILTDSGGIQEEAPSLGKPVLVMRNETERPEGVEAGTVRLVGTEREIICTEAFRLLDRPGEYQGMVDIPNPYGDGQAATRIVASISNFLQLQNSGAGSNASSTTD